MEAHPYWLEGAADVAEIRYRPFGKKQTYRMIVRRVAPTPGTQLWLQAVAYSHYAFITDREGEMLELEADHREHAVVENVIRDSKYGLGLNHMPSGKFGANAAWLALNLIAHNLCRWMGLLGGLRDRLPESLAAPLLLSPWAIGRARPPPPAATASGLAMERGVHRPVGQAPGGRHAVDDLRSSPPRQNFLAPTAATTTRGPMSLRSPLTNRSPPRTPPSPTHHLAHPTLYGANRRRARQSSTSTHRVSQSTQTER